MLRPYHANVIRISLGRLYYRTNLKEEGDKYFEQAIANSHDDKELTYLCVARSILATNPHSDKAVKILQKIPEDSWHYPEAQKLLTLNLTEKEYFDMVKTDYESGLSDTEMLNRAMYHKIANEISILKGIAYRILRISHSEDSLLGDIIQDIERVFEEINSRKAEQKLKIAEITYADYEEILRVISTTAHDISDYVNNELAYIESKTRRAMGKLQNDDPHYPRFQKLLAQLEITQTALNDLKAINEGITIKVHHFQVKELFEKWEANPKIDSASIHLDVRNGDAEFYGDEEKIKSAINELVENSLKHNFNKSDLEIHITSQDVVNPVGVRGFNIPGEQKYLSIIFSDNGKGVPDDKKDWIFQPLNTTSLEGKGSGLGLFIIRKTLTKMKGYIRETGYNGVRFEIFIPYTQE
jgi:signal transduction histidine kinase